MLKKFFARLLHASFLLAFCAILPSAKATEAPHENLVSGIVGMYVVEMWPYAHPYSAKTWTLDDWRGYASGLKKLGYNTLMIWPMIETMPDPLTASDQRSLQVHASAIDFLHRELGMHVLLVITANVVPSAAAAQEEFTTRHFFRSEALVDPGNAAAVKQMIGRREKLLNYLKAADGLVIIDSDPGGYPHSNNAEFVSLIKAHRAMLDRLRPGIELDCWAWFGWEAYSEAQLTGTYRLGNQAEFSDMFSRLKTLNPDPWGIANALPSAALARATKTNAAENARFVEAAGLGSRAFSYAYDALEMEPSLPMTNFSDHNAYSAGAAKGARGVMGNAQTHVAQLPNTFAFAKGAMGKPVTEADYLKFADRLIQGRGSLIVSSWVAMDGRDAAAMREHARELRQAATEPLKLGDLQGLLFGSGTRFVEDLAFQLDLKAAAQDLSSAKQSGRSLKTPLMQLASAADAWLTRTGYQNGWVSDPWAGEINLADILKELRSPQLSALLRDTDLQEFEISGPKWVSAIKEAAASLKE